MISEWHDGQMIVLASMPRSVSEAVTPNEDGSFTIFINESLPDKKRLEAYHHALQHIQNNDFQTGGDVQQIEAAAHKLTNGVSLD